MLSKEETSEGDNLVYDNNKRVLIDKSYISSNRYIFYTYYKSL